MTRDAIQRESPCSMVRVRRLIEITLMALSAARVHKLIISSGVTVLAQQRRVFSGEREFCRRMIE